MDTIAQLKESSIAETPLLLFDVELGNGSRAHWSTHAITLGEISYAPRVLRHDFFELQANGGSGIDGIPRISITLANADSLLSQLDQTDGFKGGRLTAAFLFYDIQADAPATESTVVFQGQLNPPDELTESEVRLTALNRMNMQRVLLPPIRIQRRCPWTFPATAEQRQEAVSGGSEGTAQRFYACGYSADLPGGCGNLDGAGQPYSSCGLTRTDCIERGMFDRDASGAVTRRFGGIEFVPASISVRSHRSKEQTLSTPSVNQARYNDFVPLAYGVVWLEPPIVFARNDGNLTRIEVLLAAGEIESVRKVIVNNIEIPIGVDGRDMTASGWWNLFAGGDRTGGFNLNFAQPDGTPLGDPYGGMAALSIVVPNQVQDGTGLPQVQVLLEGMRLERFDSAGTSLGRQFSNNPDWILLDLFRRSGWRLGEIDVGSFASAAAFCDEPIAAFDNQGSPISIRRFECNVAVRTRRTAADLTRAVRNSARLQVTYRSNGALAIFVENSLALQQPDKPAGSNALAPLNGGWPAYHYADGSDQTTSAGFLRHANGAPAIRLFSRSIADTPNRFSTEFADQFNEYQQDSLSLSDLDDLNRSGQEITGRLAVDGLTSFDHAARILKFFLDKSVAGNRFIEFDTSVKAIGQSVGDIITVTYLKEGLSGQPFRIVRLAPSANYRRVRITAQLHDDAWYHDTNGQLTLLPPTDRQPDSGPGIPDSLYGEELDDFGDPVFGVAEFQTPSSDGSILTQLEVSFRPPESGRSLAAGVPSVSLHPVVLSSGGALQGGQTLYYVVTAVDDAGLEGNPSFVVRADLPEGSGTYQVRLESLRFSKEAGSFNVYRGPLPSSVRRVAALQPLSAEFTDSGLGEGLEGAPSPHYDHANFYWRLEDVAEQFASIYSPTSIGSVNLSLAEDALAGHVTRVIRGKGAGQERKIISNTADTLVVEPPWTLEPDPSSVFVVAESTWRFGGRARTSPARFQVPNIRDRVVQVSGRSANANNVESLEGLALITRWRIGGGGLGVSDFDVPPLPNFGLSADGDGSLAISAIGFPLLDNTQSISSGLFRYWFRDELSDWEISRTTTTLDASATALSLDQPGNASVDDLIQVDGEVMKVAEVAPGRMEYTVVRGSGASTAVAHAAAAQVFELNRRTETLSFRRGFFGTPDASTWSHTVWLPSARVAYAELTVTNSFGDSPTFGAGFSELADNGLRTLQGGQFNFQIEGALSIAHDAVPSLLAQNSVSIRDILAQVKSPPVGSDLILELRVGGMFLSTLTIADGMYTAQPQGGADLAVLSQGMTIELDIVSVGTEFPGQDLTVTIRL